MISGFEEFTRKIHSFGFPAIEDNIVLCSKFDASIYKPLKLGAEQQMSSAYIRLFKHLYHKKVEKLKRRLKAKLTGHGRRQGGALPPWIFTYLLFNPPNFKNSSIFNN